MDTLHLNFEAARSLIEIYAFIWVSTSIITNVTILVIVTNIEKLALIKTWIRRGIFATYAFLILLNVPFGFFISSYIDKVAHFGEGSLPDGSSSHPLFMVGSLAAQTGIASQLVFLLFFTLSWLAVEDRAATFKRR